jgi:ligand-binding SRPBCC domain-containing protein
VAFVATYLLTASVHLSAPLARVFPFFADAENLESITPPWLRFRILTPLPIAMAEGALIDYRLRLHGIPFGWRTEIAVWQPPERFVDRQLAGPYLSWVHEHVFVPTPAGTLVTDRVRYRPRGGQLAQALFVGRDVRRIFAFRQAALLARFGGSAGELRLERWRESAMAGAAGVGGAGYGSGSP